MYDQARTPIDDMVNPLRVPAALCVWLVAAAATAQDPPPEHQHSAPSASERAWTWTIDANLFAGYNYQQRKFADFAAWESQNWAMLAGDRTFGSGRLTIQGMFSLEPLTVGRYVYAVGGQTLTTGGSPQLFQTGESYQGTPLVNYQHPHDLIMGLGATYRIARSTLAYSFGADLVGSPTLGPMPFMHRESGRNNPQAPLTHHSLDSTHISAGVLRAGVDTGAITLEGSVFRGLEPDEYRYNINGPGLDSWAARAGWHRGPWQAQFSGGRLHEPEWFEPYDVTRLTASIAFDGAAASRPLAVTLAWGENREYTPFRGIADGYLLEWDWRIAERLALYGRAEAARKEILGLGFHPKGFGHPHVFSDIDALTLGAVRDVPIVRWGRLGIGGDVTVYRMSPDMDAYYGGSRSFHAFLRWRPSATPMNHVH